jgi:predicted O-methyltransferase YrrM
MIANAHDFTQLQSLWKGIPGFFDFAELYDTIAAGIQDGATLVEVGALLGRSACYLGESLKARGKKATLLCVDTWPAIYSEGIATPIECPFEIFYANIRQSGLLDTIIPIRARSTHAAGLVKDGLDFVFIDAAHDYENCKADIQAWLPKVRSGGTLAGHDFDGTFPGVVKSVKEMLGNSFSVVGRSWVHQVP